MKVSMKDLLEAGVHFGHQTRRWNPKMKPYIFTERNDIYIIDLQHTLEKLKEAYIFVRDLASEGGIILFVGTKRQAQDAFEEHAQRCGMPYVTHRWLGGMLTNFNTIASRLGRLAKLEGMKEKGEFEALPKKEAMRLEKELLKLQRSLGGIRGMERLPNALFLIDTKNEEIAVREAHKLNLPIVAVVDTNCDPDEVNFPIPGNDDAIRSAALLAKVIADAVIEGREVWLSKQADLTEETVGEVEMAQIKTARKTLAETPVTEVEKPTKELVEEAAEEKKKEIKREEKEKVVAEEVKKKSVKKKAGSKEIVKKEATVQKIKAARGGDKAKAKVPNKAMETGEEKPVKATEAKEASPKESGAKTKAKSSTKKDSKKSS